MREEGGGREFGSKYEKRMTEDDDEEVEETYEGGGKQ